MGETTLGSSKERYGRLFRVIALSFFWGWALLWMGSTESVVGPLQTPEAVAAARLVFIGGSALSFSLFALVLGLSDLVNHRRALPVFALLAAAGSAGALFGPSERLGMFPLLVSAGIAGAAIGRLAPTWGQAFEAGETRRLMSLLSVGGLGAVAVYHVVQLLDTPVAAVAFAMLPLLSGAASLLGEAPAASPTAQAEPSPQALRAIDVGYVVFSVLAGFSVGLVVPTPSDGAGSIQIGVVAGAVLTSLVVAAWVFVHHGKPRPTIDYVPVLLMLIFALITVPYMFANTSALMRSVAGANFLCWATFFILTDPGAQLQLNLLSRHFNINARILGSISGLTASIVSFALSSAIDFHSGYMVPAFIGLSYLLIVIATFLLSSRISLEKTAAMPSAESGRARAVREIAKAHKLSQRETEIFAILAEGRTQAYVQETLRIAPSTASTHIHHIHRKLNIHSRDELLDLLEQYRDAS
ncbi:MAG: response regulator transcription factor [Coriobacteriia bacterium]